MATPAAGTARPRSRNPAILARWGATEALRRHAAYRSLDAAALTFESFYVVAARDAPGVRFAQYNNAEDKTQLFFLEQLGIRDASLPGLLALNLAEIRRANPGSGATRRPARPTRSC